MITVDIAVTVAASVAQLAALAATLNIVAGGLAIVVATASREGVVKTGDELDREPG
jgi:hypothetical protein